MEKIRKFILDTIPLPPEQLEDVISALVESGVEKYEDLNYIGESDLASCLKTVQYRKLLGAFKSSGTLAPENKALDQSVVCVAETIDYQNAVIIASGPSYQEGGSGIITEYLQSSQLAANTNCEKIKISWHRMPEELIEDLNAGRVPRPSCRREMVRIIATDIMSATTNPRRKIVQEFAKICISRYPILIDRIDASVIGSGFDSLVRQLTNRIDNIRRLREKNTGTKRKVPPTADSTEDATEIVSKPTIDSYGCVNWAPSCPAGETVESLTSKKLQMCHMDDQINSVEFVQLLIDTFYLQRNEINSGKLISELLIDWPMLFSEIGLQKHFKILTGVDIDAQLTAALETKMEELLSYFKTSTKTSLVRLFAQAEDLKEHNKVMLLLVALLAYFDEKPENVLTVSEVFNPHNIGNEAVTSPFLIVKGCVLKPEWFMLVIDRVAVNCNIEDSLVALALLFSSFYTFNIQYPFEAKATFEFLQRCFIGINPTAGSKVERKKGKKWYAEVNPKVTKLCSKVQQHSWFRDIRQ